MHWNHLIITRGQQYFQPREWICICQSFRGLLTYVNPPSAFSGRSCAANVSWMLSRAWKRKKKKKQTQNKTPRLWSLKGAAVNFKKTESHSHKHICVHGGVFYRAADIYRQQISFVSSMPLFPLPWWRHSLTDERLATVCWPASYFIGDMTDLIITHCSHKFNRWNLGIRQHCPALHGT